MNAPRGQCYITRSGKTILSSGDVTINKNPELFGIQGTFGGLLDERVKSIAHTVTFTHDGRLADLLAIMFPHGSERIGQSIFSDTPLVILDVNGDRWTYHNAALTSIGAANLTTQGPAGVTMTFTCLHVSTAEVISDEASLFTFDSAITFTQPVQNPDHILTDLYTAAWGATPPYDAMYAKDGFNLSISISTAPETSDRRGINTMILTDMSASVTFNPEGLEVTDIDAMLKHQGAGAKIGGSIRGGNDLILTGPTLIFTLKNAGLVNDNQVFSNARRRQGDVTFKAYRGANTSGSPATLFTAIVD